MKMTTTTPATSTAFDDHRRPRQRHPASLQASVTSAPFGEPDDLGEHHKRPILLEDVSGGFCEPLRPRLHSLRPRRASACSTSTTGKSRVLERKKAIDEVIKAASAVKDHLAPFPPFRRYDRNGLALYLESGYGEQLSTPIKRYIQTLLKVNMERPYGAEWPAEEKEKCREMVAPEARYIFVREASATSPTRDATRTEGALSHHLWIDDGDHVVGFVQYRFIVEEDIPVVYVYELQLESCIQGKGLGKFLMQLIELIARKNHMGAVMLTVQKANELAVNFYMCKLRYVISSISPSRVDSLMGAEMSYEILCKTFDNEAKARLEDNCVGLE